MTRLNQEYNWGSSQRNANPELTRQLGSMFTSVALAVNERVVQYVTDGEDKPHVNPVGSSQFNKIFDISSIYVRTDTNTAWIMTSRTDDENVTWTQIT
jgi:hypothetical protein